MISAKEEVLNLLKNLPDELGWEDILYEINLKHKVSLALEDYENNNIISHEDLKKKFLK